MPLKEGKRCPNCSSTLFHVRQQGEKIVLRCYRGNKCGWQMILVEAKD